MTHIALLALALTALLVGLGVRASDAAIRGWSAHPDEDEHAEHAFPTYRYGHRWDIEDRAHWVYWVLADLPAVLVTTMLLRPLGIFPLVGAVLLLGCRYVQFGKPLMRFRFVVSIGLYTAGMTAGVILPVFIAVEL